MERGSRGPSKGPITVELDDSEKDENGAVPADMLVPAYEKVDIRVEAKEGSAKLAATVRRTEDGRRPRGGRVPIANEPYVLTVAAERHRTHEADLFGTKLALDLNGDGDTEDTVELACDGDAARVDGARLEPVMDVSASLATFFRYGRSQGGGVVRLGEVGAYALLYTPCNLDAVTFGLAPADDPIGLEEAPSPALLVWIFSEAAHPGAGASLDIGDITRGEATLEVPIDHQHYYGRGPVGPEPRWFASRYAMVPLEIDRNEQRIEVEVSFEGDAERFVHMSINEAGIDADRVQTRWATAKIELPSP